MSLTLQPQKTAVVLIDLEQGIVARDLQPHNGKEVVERCARLAAAVRHNGGLVVYVHVLLNELLALPADRPRSRPPEPFAASASDLVPEAGFQPETDVLITKRQPGAFYGTHLDQALRRRQIKTLILAGIATNIGVESTARAAHDRGYALVFADDAMSSLTAEMHAFATEQIFPMMGYVRSTEEILKALP